MMQESDARGKDILPDKMMLLNGKRRAGHRADDRCEWEWDCVQWLVHMSCLHIYTRYLYILRVSRKSMD